MNKKKIIIVGGGPAGMMAAIRAGQLNQDVTLIEKNTSLGRKLLLTGKGRCNLTNDCDLDAFMSRFSKKSGQFLRDAFKVFFNKDLMRFFEKRGLFLKVERQERVFPVTDKAESVLDVLQKELEKTKARVMFKKQVKDIVVKGGRVQGVILSDGDEVLCDRLILATGGISYPHTGSTGEGITISEKCGHRIVSLRPGLVPFETKQKFPKQLSGVTLKNIRIRFCSEKKQIVSDVGELLFTRFGVSGPLVISLSGQVVDWLEKGKKVGLEIDLKPGLSEGQLEKRILKEFKAAPKKNIKNLLKSFLPLRLVDIFLKLVKIDENKRGSQVTQQERRKLASLLKGLPLEITRPRGIEFAMVTRGGISLKDVDPKTMASRVVKNLFVVGEMVDVDGDTGGFNLQAAFSTGYLAGQMTARL
ncbi:MAG: NAD(P)/FAD-dependent oxidoreductase [Candidatus Omnitrophica bacterium]|nr:NAD(P)/FAD-dependent oxidoreductase [Candidatus Omnitrophota bacterium]